MDGLEDGNVVADVGRWSEAETAGETRGEIAQDVAVHVGRDDDVELLGAHRQLVRAIVDQDVFGRDRWVVRRELLEGVLQQALGELHDVRLRGAVDRFAAFGQRKSERELHDFLAAFARYDLQPFGDARRLHVFNAGVEILDVLANDDDVELPPGEGSLHTG